MGINFGIFFSGGTIKSYSKRKLSTDDKINDVDLDYDGLSESKTTVTIQLDPHQQNNPQLFQVIYFVLFKPIESKKGFD